MVGSTTFNIPKGNEPMRFTPQFQKAVGIIQADLSQVEQRLADDLCRNQDRRLQEKLASP